MQWVQPGFPDRSLPRFTYAAVGAGSAKDDGCHPPTSTEECTERESNPHAPE